MALKSSMLPHQASVLGKLMVKNLLTANDLHHYYRQQFTTQSDHSI